MAKNLACTLAALLILPLLSGCAGSKATPTPAATRAAESIATPATTVAPPTLTLAIPPPTESPEPTAPVPTRTLTVPPPTNTPEPPPTPYNPAAGIDAYLDDLVEQGTFSGSVLVARDGEILLAKGYGLADHETEQPNGPQTRHRLCSITKQFTAMGIMILQDQGRLDVGDLVCDYVPDCPAAWQGITLHHLLVHTSGIPNFTDLPGYEETKAEPVTPAQLVARFKDEPLNFARGAQWSYSNSGYILLGTVIEHVSGQSYEVFLQEQIFGPLGMADSGYDHHQDGVATGYTGPPGRWYDADTIDMSVPYAAGALYSTVEDLYRWDQALYREQLLPQALLDIILTPHVDSPIGGFGYGWIVDRKYNQPVIRHGGGGDGFVTTIERYPEDRVTIILLSNRESSDLVAILAAIGGEVFRD